MTTFNTGNPVPSTAVRDLYDNAENFDTAVNGLAPTWADRLGRIRKSWAGLEAEFNAFLAASGVTFNQFMSMSRAEFDAFMNASDIAFQQFLVSSGYQDLGEYAAGIQITARNQIFRRDGEFYRSTAGLNLPYTLTGDWATEGPLFLAIGDASLRQELSVRLPTDVIEYGALGDGLTLNDAAFRAAEAVSDQIYVPEGVFRLSSPMDHGFRSQFYGPGILRYDNAVWWRRGGSSGATDIRENYTLFYEYANQSDVSITFDGVAQAFVWIDAFTINAPGSTAAVNILINIANGILRLTGTPESPRSYNMLSGGGGKVDPYLPSPLISPQGMMNAGFGSRTLQNLRRGENNTGFGARTLVSVTDGNNQTAMGFQVLYRSTGSDNSGFGSTAGEWLTSGEQNSYFGGAAGGHAVTASYNTAMGWYALGDNQTGNYNTALGWRAGGNTGASPDGTRYFSESTMVGAFCGSFAYGGKNTFMGYRAGVGPNGGSDGYENTAVGFFALRSHNGADMNTAVGVSALLALISGQSNVAVGHSAASSLTTAGDVVAVGANALASATAAQSTAVGASAARGTTTGVVTAFGWHSAFANTTGTFVTAIGQNSLPLSNGSENTAVGYDSGASTTTGTRVTFIGSRAGRLNTTGNDLVAVGRDALYNNLDGINNTAIGVNALRLAQDGSPQTSFVNTTGVGHSAAVSGSNQIQLGNPATTTYVYNTVQSRSDAKDKADIEETSIGLEFLLELECVQGRWDMREDYVQVDEDGNVTKLAKDGSKKRKRLHQWFIAQQVAEVCESMGVEFGGLQHHAVNGGLDVWSLGYDEFIPPVVKALQQINARQNELEARITKLEKA